jgi:calcineurin-like phosphoesterase family protein
MSRVFFISDLHIGHKNVHTFRTQFSSEAEHREYIVDCWNSKVTKRDKVYVLGDAVFTMEGIATINSLHGSKTLIRGNHDNLDTTAYLKCFDQVEGMVKYKFFWLTHSPMHPVELRGKVNIHGHVHFATINDIRYENVCCENISYTPISYDELINKRKERVKTFYGDEIYRYKYEKTD